MRLSATPSPPSTYGIVYGMQKTTVYLSGELKAQIAHAAATRGISEAEVIRDALRSALGPTRPKPRGALYESQESLSERVDELLAEGFGN